MLKVTTLLENSTIIHNLLSQHGQSLLIELGEYKILFDVGEVYEGFSYNLEQYGLTLSDISHIIISHRHIDHLGSLKKMLPLLTTQELLLPTQMGTPDIKKPGPKYVHIETDNPLEYNVAATPDFSDELLEYKRSRITSLAEEILPNLWTTGCIGTKMEEQALVYDQKSLGLTLMVGCSHPGLESLVKKAQQVTGNDKVRSIIGGFHFNPLSDEEVMEQAEYLKTLNLEYLLPNHCTGIRQTDILRKCLTETVKISKTYSVGTGNSVMIGEEISFDFA